jgi:hypothetical protein
MYIYIYLLSIYNNIMQYSFVFERDITYGLVVNFKRSKRVVVPLSSWITGSCNKNKIIVNMY